MSKPMKSAFVVGIVIAAAGVLVSIPAVAADLSVPGAARQARYEAAPCGRCGCLRVSWERHRVVESTYGLDYDPRNFDQTEPYFYLGRMRAYPQFWVEADPGQ
jgi:hypothetical protein